MIFRKIKKANCTETTIGTIIKNVSKGIDCPTLVTVEYVVDGKNYKITESIKWKCELIKIGFLPIGQKCYAKMGATTVGSTAEISFNPNNPAEAFITKNVGKVNVV